MGNKFRATLSALPVFFVAFVVIHTFGFAALELVLCSPVLRTVIVFGEQSVLPTGLLAPVVQGRRADALLGSNNRHRLAIRDSQPKPESALPLLRVSFSSFPIGPPLGCSSRCLSIFASPWWGSAGSLQSGMTSDCRHVAQRRLSRPRELLPQPLAEPGVSV